MLAKFPVYIDEADLWNNLIVSITGVTPYPLHSSKNFDSVRLNIKDAKKLFPFNCFTPFLKNGCFGCLPNETSSC